MSRLQKTIKVKGAKRGPITFKPDSPDGRALSKTPENFEEAVMQFFTGGGRVRTDDFRRYLGIEPIKEKYLWVIKNDGIHFDVMHDHLPNSFGIEEHGSMAEISAIGEVLRSYHTKNSMVEELLNRMNQPLDQEIEPEDVIEQMEDATENNVESYVPESVDNLLTHIYASKETMSIFTSGRYFDENGNINWNKLKDLAEKDPGYFTGGFPFSLTETEYANFKALLNDTDRQRNFEEKIAKHHLPESGVEGDILRTGTPGDEEGGGGAAEELTEGPAGEPAEPEVREYQYKMLARPFDIGTFPKEGFVKSDNDPQGGYQILTYNRKLTPEEQRKWEFLPLTVQSTHPHGVRLKRRSNKDFYLCFNPRTRTGCDLSLSI